MMIVFNRTRNSSKIVLLLLDVASAAADTSSINNVVSTKI